MSATTTRPQASASAVIPEPCLTSIDRHLATIASRMFDLGQLLKTIDRLLDVGVTERANQSDSSDFRDDADQLTSLIMISRGQVESVIALADNAYEVMARTPSKPRRTEAFEAAAQALDEAERKLDKFRAIGADFPGDVTDVHTAALKGMLTAPANNAGQIHRKMQTFLAEFGDTQLDGVSCLSPILADLDRLAKAEG